MRTTTTNRVFTILSSLKLDIVDFITTKQYDVFYFTKKTHSIVINDTAIELRLNRAPDTMIFRFQSVESLEQWIFDNK
jgi:hypothetical protein